MSILTSTRISIPTCTSTRTRTWKNSELPLDQQFQVHVHTAAVQYSNS